MAYEIKNKLTYSMETRLAVRAKIHRKAVLRINKNSEQQFSLVNRRKGLNVYYRLTEPKDKIHQRLINIISECIGELKTGKEDLKNLNKLKKKGV